MSFRTRWALVFLFGVVLRLALWSGFGLGDDPNFFIAYHGIFVSGAIDPHAAYDFRFAFWIPVVLCMKLLGSSEVGFTAFITLCSIVNVILVYLLARQEWERPYALLAMALLAAFPLEVLCSTLFVIDIPLATYAFAAFWLYRRAFADGRTRRARLASAAGAAILLFCSYSTKQWAVLVGPLFLFEMLRDLRRSWLPASVTGGGFLALVAAYFGWQWVRFHDPFYDIHLVRTVAIFLPHSRDILLDYPRMLFFKNENGSYFAGWYPHALALLAVVCITRTLRAGKWLLYFIVLLALLAGAPSHREHGQWVVLVPHIFRYLSLLSIPLCLALAAYVRELFLWRRPVGIACTAILLVLGVVQSVVVTGPSRDAFSEQRRAIAVLREFPEGPVWCDGEFLWRFTSFAARPQDAGRARWIRSEEATRRAGEFSAISNGMVVTGGGRLPWYGCTRCTANLGAFPVPPTWTLVKEFPGAVTHYREEPRRVWRVSAAAADAQRLLGEQPAREAKVALLRALVERGDNVLAAEAGELLLSDAGPADRDQVLYLTGRALLRTQRSQRGERLLAEHFEHTTDAGALRADLVELALAAAVRGDFPRAHEWAARLHEHFPDAPPDPQLVELESGLAEGLSMYHSGKLEAARQRFAGIAESSSGPLRRRARYFLTLTLFRMNRLADAVEQADSYRVQYGEDADWVELHYRHAEDLLVTDPAAAAGLLRDIQARFPQSMWATEAGKRLALLPDAGSPP